MKIVHVLPRFAAAGPERSILAAARYAAEQGLRQEHCVCTLEAEAAPFARLMARRAGMPLLLGPAPAARAELLAGADVVLLHYWNCPAMAEFLRSPLPPLRLAIWLTIFGGHAPQAIPRPLLDFADLVIATSPGTLELPEFSGCAQSVPVVYGIGDFERLEGFSPRPHNSFHVGYVGSLTPAKLHPAFVAMSAAAHPLDMRFMVCGTGDLPDLQRQATDMGAAERFTWLGYVENIRAVLEQCDAFGYPLCPQTYATSEKALQEAMWVGLPPLVFPYGGVRWLVQDGVTGRVVHSEAEYTAGLEWLCQHPEECRRLGQNAKAFARRQFEPRRLAAQLAEQLEALLSQPKRDRAWPQDGNTPADWFVASLGDHAGPFARSLHAPPSAARDTAETEIGAISQVGLKCEGGLAHFRNRWPEDPHLRLWCGLALARQGKAELAKGELLAAAAGGQIRMNRLEAI